MSITLPPDLAAQVHAQIATGLFRSEEEVLREALSTLDRQQRSSAKLQAMVREAEADVAAGRIAEFDREELKREVRARLAAEGITD